MKLYFAWRKGTASGYDRFDKKYYWGVWPYGRDTTFYPWPVNVLEFAMWINTLDAPKPKELPNYEDSDYVQITTK